MAKSKIDVKKIKERDISENEIKENEKDTKRKDWILFKIPIIIGVALSIIYIITNYHLMLIPIAILFMLIFYHISLVSERFRWVAPMG